MKTVIGLDSTYMLVMQVDETEQIYFYSFVDLSADNHKAQCFFSHCCETLRGQHSIAWSYWALQQWLSSGLT